ncbi:DNRLRE domain-containing protein [Streptomyces sp. NPDC045470]|uniref:DNRLRE domain-containing protein n=1 Tax=Streptomyces sp. NPDC045470 TaxID=3155469 RepID=UPI0033CAF631
MPTSRSLTGWKPSGPWYPVLVCGVVGGLAVPTAWAAGSDAHDTKSRQSAAQQAEFQRASEQAASSGRRVEVQSQRTDTVRVYADPSGTYTTEQSLPKARAPRGPVGLWTSVNKKYPDASYWAKTGDVARVGHEDETGGTWRSFITMGTRDLQRTGTIKRASFVIRNTYSWSCAKRPVQLWDTGRAYKSTTWNQQPKWYKLLATVTDAKGHSAKECPAGVLTFDVTDNAKAAKSNKWPDMTLGLRAANENDTHAWKKFAPSTAKLAVTWSKG